MKTALAPCLILLGACASTAPTTTPLVAGGPTPHTRGSVDAGPSADPSADLARLADILAGRWVGEAFGGVVEETWNPPLGGEILGTFRLVVDDEPVFSEIIVISDEEGRVVMRLKHFNPGLVGWEEKADSITFPLVEVSGSTAWFGGLTFHRSGDSLVSHLAMRRGEEVGEEVFRYRRVTL